MKRKSDEETCEATRSDSGMTLIELAVAMVLTSLLIGGIYTGVVSGMNLNYAVAQRVAAFGLCRERLEQMRSSEYADVTSDTFGNEQLDLTHLGGSERLPLVCARVSTIATLDNPARKAVEVEVTWQYRGIDYKESVAGLVFARFASVLPGLTGDIGGEININPNNSPDNEFVLTLPDGSTVTRDDLHQNYAGYTGPATLVHIKPKGNGNQNSLTLNGDVFTVMNGSLYDIEADNMTVNLYNDNVNPQGKANGKWWIGIVATGGTITSN